MEKKIYEKPELKGAKLFEAGATSTCCKVSAATCSTANKTSFNKGVRTSATS